MNDFVQTLLIACVPAAISALITGFVTSRVACKNAKQEIDKIDREFQHKLELIDKTTNNNVAENAVDKVLDRILDTPEMKKRISQSVRNAPSGKRRK